MNVESPARMVDFYAAGFDQIRNRIFSVLPKQDVIFFEYPNVSHTTSHTCYYLGEAVST